MKNRNINFVGNRRKLLLISLSIITVGLIFNFIFGTQFGIQFTGGAIVKYSYSGNLDEASLRDVIQDSTSKTVSIQISKSILSASENENTNNVSVEFYGRDAISLEQQKAMTTALENNFPSSNFQQIESSSVNPSMGRMFFLKCVAAIIIASVLMVIYVAFRFRKIGGWSAGVMALVALFHDIIMVYFTFIIFRLPLDSNFVAVVLMILGYSLNDTIVIYDRIRENRKLYGTSIDVATLVNNSINQTLIRTINTALTTTIAIGTVLVVAIIYNLPSVIAFSLPMLVGIVFGCYSSIIIAGPWWVAWQEHKNKKASDSKK